MSLRKWHYDVPSRLGGSLSCHLLRRVVRSGSTDSRHDVGCCKSELDEKRCRDCGFRLQENGAVPVLLSESPIAVQYREIAQFYDQVYGSRTNVWEDVARRGAEFTRFLSSQVQALSPRRFLDVGCGEGFLLRSVSAGDKCGTEISSKAIDVASRSSLANLCQACAEELPYRSDYFDVVTSVGVTEHCIDDVAATSEAYRVLRPNGRYFMGVTLEGATWGERIRTKVEDFLYPHFRPVELVRWGIRKYVRPDPRGRVIQPIMHRYTPEGLQEMFERAGFRIAEIITRRDRQELISAFRVYVLEK